MTDQFGAEVAGADVHWLGRTQTATRPTGPDGIAQFDALPAGAARVCADQPARGQSCAGNETVNIEKDRMLELTRQLEPHTQLVAVVMSATVDPGGVGADGRSLDVTLRIAVTEGQPGTSWFDDGELTYSRVQVQDCAARTGDELAQLGPACVRRVDGSDVSYSFGNLNDLGVVKGVDLPPGPWAVGLLIDQSDAGLSPDWAPNDPRLFGARVLADRLLPDAGLVLAGFASDEPSGSSSSLPQRPVTFFPVESPGMLTSRPEVFATLDDLSALVGGGAPLYEAIAAGVDFMAARIPSNLRRALVVLADGMDSTCGTPAGCAERRRMLVDYAHASGVQLFLVGWYRAGYCFGSGSTYCLDIHAKEALRLLAREGGFPLAVHEGPAFNSSLELVHQWLSGSMTVQDVRFRLTSETEGAFAPGAVVQGELSAVNPSMCPFDCWTFLLPFSVAVPR